ncbi:triose-phosphate isomerase [Fluviicola chungangensis]|uniref:Triosephosphate isomerase n=1 Tax=Fluviicola chungangensis TaxID=2597671 RepID=A0A556MMT6_9FLAO|nr:triose-phosphate isomerase [Fluviicola chungangensis]TSJ41250.1 triose-phosphate isomerase [Fluviicola chungangensis]
MRSKIVAGNWKMNLSEKEAKELCKEVNNMNIGSEIEVYIFPPMLYVSDCKALSSKVKVGAQNAYPKDSGAYTGEVSMWQLKEAGIDAVLIGHSERREYFGEDHSFLKQKLDSAIAHGITPFFCCGEPLEIRQNGTFLSYVKNQLEESVFHLSATEFEKVVLAYEPIWAIGTGQTATAEQAEEMHAAIRSWVEEKYGKELAGKTSVLYGGSCNPGNAQALFACENVDGGLIGGASLKAADFSVLVAERTWTILN